MASPSLGIKKVEYTVFPTTKGKMKILKQNITPLSITLNNVQMDLKNVFLQLAFKTYFTSENEHYYCFTVLENFVQPVLCASNSLPLRR